MQQVDSSEQAGGDNQESQAAEENEPIPPDQKILGESASHFVPPPLQDVEALKMLSSSPRSSSGSMAKKKRSEA